MKSVQKIAVFVLFGALSACSFKIPFFGEKEASLPPEIVTQNVETIEKGKTETLFSYQKEVPENAFFLAFKNTSDFLEVLANKAEVSEKLVSELQKELNITPQLLGNITPNAVQSLLAAFEQTKFLNLYIHGEPQIIIDFSKTLKLSFLLPEFSENFSKKIPEGLCFSLETETTSEVVRGWVNSLKTVNSVVEGEKNENPEISKISIGCQNETPPKIENISAESNLVLVQNGEFFKNSSDGSAEVLNHKLVKDDRKSLVSAVSVFSSGYETKTLELYTKPELQAIRKEFLEGSAKQEKYFMMPGSLHEFLVEAGQTPDLFVFSENKFGGLDWAHLEGKLKKNIESVFSLLKNTGHSSSFNGNSAILPQTTLPAVSQNNLQNVLEKDQNQVPAPVEQLTTPEIPGLPSDEEKISDITEPSSQTFSATEINADGVTVTPLSSEEQNQGEITAISENTGLIQATVTPISEEPLTQNDVSSETLMETVTPTKLGTISMLSSLLSSEKIAGTIQKYPSTKEEIIEFFKEKLQIPAATDGHCYFYAVHKKLTDQFGVFADAESGKIEISGSQKVQTLFPSYFEKHNIKMLNCQTPEISGFTVVNLNEQ